MHEGLVGARTLVGTPYLQDARLRAEYAAEIAPRTQAMLNRVLSMQLPQLTPKRVLDLGAGTGIVGATLAQRFGGAVHVTAVDRVPSTGIIAADLSRAARPTGVNGSFDLVVAAHLLNELRGLDALARARLVMFWLTDFVAPGGHLLLIEPALRETGRALLEVRDQVIGAGAFVHAPCLTQAPCPALADAKDWCHDSAPRPSLTRADFSYLLLAAHAPPPVLPDALRVVSDLKKEKGRQRLFGCGPSGRRAYVLQSRDVTGLNEAFLALDRGALCRLAGTQASGDGERLSPSSMVERLDAVVRP